MNNVIVPASQKKNLENEGTKNVLTKQNAKGVFSRVRETQTALVARRRKRSVRTIAEEIISHRSTAPFVEEKCLFSWSKETHYQVRVSSR